MHPLRILITLAACTPDKDSGKTGEVSDTAAECEAALERCDGVDNDCDGEVDESTSASDPGALSFFEDADGDGVGATSTLACTPPEGHVATGGDCDDLDAEVHPGATEQCNGADDDCDDEVDEDGGETWYGDVDGDGYGDPGAAIVACDAPDQTVDNAGDCDDTDARNNPEGQERCDGIDNDCDGYTDELVTTTYYQDSDADGYGDADNAQDACSLPTGYAVLIGDCDDTEAAVNPGALETCDEIDNDCDDLVDETDADGAPSWYADADSDGFGDPDDTAEGCATPSGYTDDASDCDDHDADVNPDADEICDEIDNNCDGAVDEDGAIDASAWYADADSDGYGDALDSVLACAAPSGRTDDGSDCDDTDPDVSPGATEAWFDGLDSDCDGEEEPDTCAGVPGQTEVAWDDSCAETTVSTSSWSISTEWDSATLGYSGGGNHKQVMMTPVVGQLSDDNGDGAIDELDVPDVVFNAFKDSGYNSDGHLRIFSGDGTGQLASASKAKDALGTDHKLHGTGGVAIADIDGDGLPDVITTTVDAYVVAFEADLTVKWVSDAPTYSGYGYPSVQDMDGDGSPEIIVTDTIFDSEGLRLIDTDLAGEYTGYAIDIDDDGELEYIAGGAALELDGTEVFDTELTGHTATADFDGDLLPEVVLRANGTVYLLDDDGSELWSTALQGDSPPSVADFDGDGEPEICTSGKDHLTALDTDGAVLWTLSGTSDQAYGTLGCVAFDFDGDGAAEALYADRSNLYIVDGATGTALYTNTNAVSASLWEYPVVADIDNDGQAEIILAANNYAVAGGWTGVYVLGEDNDGWTSARRTWNQHAYWQDHIDEDGTLVASPGMPWLSHNSFRAQASWSDSPTGAPNLEAYILGACEDCSAEDLELFVSVESTGALFAPDGVQVALYAVDGSTETLLATATTDGLVLPGVRTEPLSFALDHADVGASGLKVVVDDDGTGTGTVDECDETDNSDTWAPVSCE